MNRNILYPVKMQPAEVATHSSQTFPGSRKQTACQKEVHKVIRETRDDKALCCHPKIQQTVKSM